MGQPTLLLSQDDVKSILDMPTVLKIAEKVYRAHGEGTVLLPPKLTLDLAAAVPPRAGFLMAMPACLADPPVAGLKWVAGFRENPKRGLPPITALIVLVDPENGAPLSVMDGTYITAIRTGAASAVFARALARKNASILGIIGAGTQGRMHLRAMARVFSLKEVRVIDVQEEVAERFRSDLSAELGIGITVAGSRREAVDGADVVCTVTAADEPLVKHEWVKKGTLVVSVGSGRELDPELVLSADRIVVDDRVQTRERGELAGLFASGRLTDRGVHAEIGEVLAGRKRGREDEEEIIVAVHLGLGSLDLGCAWEALRKARERGLGTPFRFL
jgi:alanine dehydrogenase